MPAAKRGLLHKLRTLRFYVVNPLDSCCAGEVEQSFAPQYGPGLPEIAQAQSPEQADVLVLAGPVSKKAAPELKKIYDAMPEPKYVIAFGACAMSGGAFFDSYAVAKGAEKVLPVTLTVSGCPPRPLDFIAALRKLRYGDADAD
jgi:NADH-quinone oxidoreductase subunit B